MDGLLEGVVEEEVIGQGWDTIHLACACVLVLWERHRGFDGVVTGTGWTQSIIDGRRQWDEALCCACRPRLF